AGEGECSADRVPTGWSLDLVTAPARSLDRDGLAGRQRLVHPGLELEVRTLLEGAVAVLGDESHSLAVEESMRRVGELGRPAAVRQQDETAASRRGCRSVGHRTSGKQAAAGFERRPLEYQPVVA